MRPTQAARLPQHHRQDSQRSVSSTGSSRRTASAYCVDCCCYWCRCVDTLIGGAGKVERARFLRQFSLRKDYLTTGGSHPTPYT